MIIALFTKMGKNNTQTIAYGIAEFLKNKNVKVVAEDAVAESLAVSLLSSVNPEDVNFIISIGGDGTILRVFHTYPDLDAPILGINMGGLGFMADIPVDDIYPSLENLINGKYKVQNRIMMQGSMPNQNSSFAINEIVVHRAKNPSLIDLAIYVDGDYLNTFSADGIIVSTPNGSTAYSLAAGGPILTPELEAFVLTPICPHTISNKPIVLMPKHEIQVHYISEYDPAEIIFDGLAHYPIHKNDVLSITRSTRTFKSMHMLQYDYFATLRTKLGWTGKLKHNQIKPE